MNLPAVVSTPVTMCSALQLLELLFQFQVPDFALSAFQPATWAQGLIHLELLCQAHLFQLKEPQLLRVPSSTPEPALMAPDAKHQRVATEQSLIGSRLVQYLQAKHR